MNFVSFRKSTISLVIATFVIAGVSIVPAVSAYGNHDQWQTGFAGTAQGGSSGFWGWCAFGGSSGSSTVGTTGTTADCQIANYFRPVINTFHVSMDGTGWVIATGSAFLPPGVPGFFFTGGTAELTGPGAKVLSLLFGVPVGVPFDLSAVCNFSGGPATLAGSPCDTGIPAIPGHFHLNSPGFELQIQVTKLP